MRWKYAIHHAWDEERMTWAEAFVRPDDPSYTGQSLWVTIDCLGAPPDETFEAEAVERYNELLAWLGDRPYRVAENGEVGDSDLVVGARDFTKEQFLEWVAVWLRAKGLRQTELIAAPLEEFAGTDPEADLQLHLRQHYSDRSEER